MKKLKRILIGFGIFLVLYTLSGFLVLPAVLKSVLPKKLSENLNRKVTIEDVKFNPYSFELWLKGFNITERDSSDAFLSFNELYVNAQIISVFKTALILKSIKIDGPYVQIICSDNKKFNFSDIIEKDKKDIESKENEKKESDDFKFSLNNIEISNGSLKLQDDFKGVKHVIKDLNLAIPFISNFPYDIGTYVKPNFNANVNDTPLNLGGETKPFSESQETTLDIFLKDLDIAHYLPYVPAKMNFKVLSGSMDLRARLNYSLHANKKPFLKVSGSLDVNGLKVHDAKDRPLLTLPRVSVSIAPSEVTSSRLRLSSVVIESPEFHLIRESDSSLNVNSLFPEEERKTPAAPKEGEKSPFLVEVDDAGISGGRVMFIDNFVQRSSDKDAPSKAVLPIEKIDLKVTGFSNKKDAKAKLALNLNTPEKGRMSVQGDFGVNPIFSNLKLDLKKVSLKSSQPYINENFELILTGGELSVVGDLQVEQTESKGISARFGGEASIDGFSSIDQANANDFLKWKSLYAGGIDAGVNPTKVHISKVALTDFYSRMIINNDGTLNVQNIIKKSEGTQNGPSEAAPDQGEVAEKEDGEKTAQEEKAAEEKEGGAQKVSVDTISLQGGEINFSDSYIKPSYTARLTEVAGRVSGLSSMGTKAADVSLLGKLDNHSPLEITGSIDPLKEDLFVDLKLSFSDIDLSPMTPYSGRYIGRTIEKGKLFLELKYLVAERKLDSQNNVVLDQFTLGETVDSPDATKLPVGLAISLLKDRQGKINLDIPVGGDLSNPQFSLGKVIAQVIVNLLTKALTSPFALIGALAGGGEELGYVQFDYGSSLVSEEGRGKLNKVADILFERPALKLDLAGHVDPEKDPEGLTTLFFQQKLKAQKLKEMVKGDKKAIALDEVEIKPEEHERYLKKAYDAETFPKPKYWIGIEKRLPPGEMEKLILTHIEIKEDDLRLLAQRRAGQVRDYLLETGRVEPERIFLVEPKSLVPEKMEKLKNSRVDLKLK